MEAQPHVLALDKIHRSGRFTPLAPGAPGDCTGDIQVAQQLLGCPNGNWVLFLQLPPSAEEKLRVCNHPLPDGRKSSAPGRIEFTHLLSGELMPGDRFGETFAVVAVGARHRYQILHGRVRADLPSPNLLLDGFGQLPN